MKAEEFVFALNEADDKFITEPFEENKTAKILHFKKWAALVAAIIIIGAMATVAVAEVFDIGFRLSDYWREDMTGSYTAEGYTLELNIETHPQDYVGKMEYLREILDQKSYIYLSATQIEDPKTRAEFIERHGKEYAKIEYNGIKDALKSFGDKETAVEYIGCDSLAFPNIYFDDEKAVVFVSGYSGNELHQAMISVSDISTGVDDPKLIYSYGATIYFDGTETLNERLFVGDEGETFTEERFTTENGTEYLVVKCMTANERIRRISAFLIKENIFYRADIISKYATYEIEDYTNPEDYIDFIHNWANSY